MLAQGVEVEANVRWSIRQILESPEGRKRPAQRRMKRLALPTSSKQAACGFANEVCSTFKIKELRRITRR